MNKTRESEERTMTKKQGIDAEKYDENMRFRQTSTDDLIWLCPKEKPFQINGLAWFDQDQVYRRVPVDPEVSLPEAVDHLGDCPAGGQVRFQTDATRLSIRVKLASQADMSHMTAVGQCGFDCYVGDFGEQQYVASTIYNHFADHYELQLFDQGRKKYQTITLYFPLYQGVENVEIGVNSSAQIDSPPPYERTGKVIFYGTSITQGGCATRPGLAYTNILSRRFNQEIINLGFSGSGKGEKPLAKLISAIKNPACLVLDYEPNCVSTELYQQTLPTFIATYREIHSDVPILLLSKFPYAMEKIDLGLYQERMERLHFQKKLINNLRAKGDKNIYFYEGTNLLGENLHECTVDGVHPNDLGFMSIADQLTPVLKKILHKDE